MNLQTIQQLREPIKALLHESSRINSYKPQNIGIRSAWPLMI